MAQFFQDSSTYGNNMKLLAGATISTGTTKFGAGSFDNTAAQAYSQTVEGATLMLDNGNASDVNFWSDLADGVFTIDYWQYLASGSGGNEQGCSMTGYRDVNNYIGWFLMLNSAGSYHYIGTGFYKNGTFEVNASTYAPGTGGLTLDTWHHVAIVRGKTGSSCAGSDWHFFVDGVDNGQRNLGSGTWGFDYTGFTCSTYLGGGWFSGGNQLGYIDEMRVSKGVCRWTSDFTPPSSPYT